MKGDKIKYRDGYKYQLAEGYSLQLPWKPEKRIDHDFLYIDETGLLVIFPGYAWDGASGPTVDTDSSMRGSLVHDALYQLMREGRIPISCRGMADQLLKDICIEDGMWRWRAHLWWSAVSDFAKGAALPKNNKHIYEAP